MKKVAGFVALVIVGAALLFIGRTPRGETQIRKWLIGEREEPAYVCAGGSWRPEADKLQGGQEGEIVTLSFTSQITLENVWDPFSISGPVHSTHSNFIAWYLQIKDVTNVLGEQPEWWPGSPPDCPCGQQSPVECWGGQIWSVVLQAGLTPPGYAMDAGWFYLCDPLSPCSASSYSGTFSVSIANLERVSTCEFEVRATSAYVARFEYCLDENGTNHALEVSGLLAPDYYSVGDKLSLEGGFEGCLHKGTAGKKYISQEMECSAFIIDLDDWEEFFCGNDARAYGEKTVARWEAVNDFAADGCADDSWACEERFGGPHMDVDGSGQPWIVFDHGQSVLVYRRSSPQRPWEQHTNAFDDWDHYEPCITHFSDRRILVGATSIARKRTEFVESNDAGMSWHPLEESA